MADITTIQGFNPPTASVSGNPIYFGGLNSAGSIVGAVFSDGGIQAMVTPGSVVTVWKDSSVLAGLTNTSASVITVFQAPSIVGTYADNTAYVLGSKGVYTLAVRNDSTASMIAADARYTPLVVGPVGETIVSNAPISKWINATASITSGVDTPIVAAQGASIFTYITSAQLSMAPGNVQLVKFKSSSGGTTVHQMYLPSSTAGIHFTFNNPIKTLVNAGFIASISAIGSVLVNVQGFISKFDV